MLHSVKVVNEEWRVLVVDEVTVKVFSAACKLSDVTEENVSRACPFAPGAPRACAARRFAARRALPRALTRTRAVRSCGGPLQASRTHAAYVGCDAPPRARALSSSASLTLSTRAAIYFISPTERSVRQLIEDFQGPLQMYKRAHVFFSNRALRIVQPFGWAPDAVCPCRA